MTRHKARIESPRGVHAERDSKCLTFAVLLRDSELFHRQCPRDYLTRLARENGIHMTIVSNDQELEEILPTLDILACNDVPREVFARTQPSRLKWIHVLAAGVEKVLVPEVAASSVTVTNSAGTMAAEVAEHALALILALTRRIDIAVCAQVDQHWARIREEHPPISLAALTVGIVGYGHIGREIARRIKPFGTRIIGLCRSAAPPDLWADRIVGTDGFRELIAESDVSVIALPQTRATKHLFGKDEFRAMKRSSYLVNVARGAIVDETALENALRNGEIAGAASDVFATEPLAPNSRLWKVPGLLITPHVGGASQHVWFKIIDLFFHNLGRFRQGETLGNIVDKETGY